MSRCLIDGRERGFARWLAEPGIAPRLPLVADDNSALVNASFKAVDETRNLVTFYAPSSIGRRPHEAESAPRAYDCKSTSTSFSATANAVTSS